MEWKGKLLTLRTDVRPLPKGKWSAAMTAILGDGKKWPIVLRGDFDSRAEAEKACRDAAPGWLARTERTELPEHWR